jgi:phospholipid-translocating ATPase
MDEIESGLILQGVTAVEDQLQDEVPSTLELFIDAGVSVWLITGDKVGTAKNIAVACKLLGDRSVVDWIELTTDYIDKHLPPPNNEAHHHAVQKSLKDLSLSEIAKVMESAQSINTNIMLSWKQGRIKQLDGARGELIHLLQEVEATYPGLKYLREQLQSLTQEESLVISEKVEASIKIKMKSMALIIDEKLIDYCLACFELNLLQLTRKCSSVICCRARKDQKASMVRLIKNNVPGSVTLAVGDGANDVAMIKVFLPYKNILLPLLLSSLLIVLIEHNDFYFVECC